MFNNAIFQFRPVTSSNAKIIRVPGAILIIPVFALKFLTKITQNDKARNVN